MTIIKAIAINSENIKDINAAMNAAEGPRVQERILRYDSIERLVEQLEQHPAVSLLPKKSRKGITAWLQQSHKLPSSYRYSADATAIKVCWKAKGGWHLTEVQRVNNVETKTDRVEVSLPDDAAADATERFFSTFMTAS